MKAHLKFIAFVLISLIVAIPFYVADAYAGSLTVTRSSGSAGIDKYFDGLGDNWIIEAKASLDGKTVTSDMVTARFTPEEKFQSCAPSGNYYTCRWESGLFSSEEDTYTIDVVLKDPATGQTFSSAAGITVDKTAPVITINSARQKDTKVEINLNVNDGNSATSSLLDRIEFYAGAMLLQTIPDIDKIEYSGVVELTVPKVGTFNSQTLVVKAYDRLGHEKTAESSQFVLDLTVPFIDDASFRIGNLADYAPSGKRYFDISVNISEDKGLADVSADFSDLGIGVVKPDSCTPFAGTDVYRCLWANRYVSIDGPVDIKITASDSNGNTITDTISKNYIVDNTPPDIEFIGTAANYEGQNYVILNKQNTIVARLKEGESGITASEMRMNFINVNPSLKDYIAADNCGLAGESLWECYWNITPRKEGVIILVDAPDNAGNELPSGELSAKNRASLLIDSEAPVFIDAVITSLGALYTETREYFQSDDFIRIEARAKDNIGIKAYADFSDAVLDGGEHVEAECTKGTDKEWTCVWEGIGPLVTGYAHNVPIRLVFEDFGGNSVTQTEFRDILEIAGAITNPNYWNIGRIENYPDAIDRQTTQLTSQRMYFRIPLSTSNQNVKLLATGVKACRSLTSVSECGGDCLSSYYLVNNYVYSKEPYLVLELNKFNGEVGNLSFSCMLDIFSQYGNKAIEYPQTKEINVTIPFYNLPLGQQGTALADKIKDEKQKLKSGFYGTIGVLNEIVKWGGLICNTLDVFNKVVVLFSTVVMPASDIARAFPPTVPVAVGICNAGTGLSAVQKNLIAGGGPGYLGLKGVCDIVTCRKASLSIISSGFENWQEDILTKYANLGYKTVLGSRTVLGSETKPSPYDSLFLSMLTLCVPGIVYNLDKYRQVECRYIYCLEKEVPAGLATVSSCRELCSYQKCKYVTGELFHMVPPIAALDVLLNKIKSIITDPIGLFNIGATLACRASCAGSSKVTGFCLYYAWGKYILDLANDMTELSSASKTINKDYCSEVL